MSAAIKGFAILSAAMLLAPPAAWAQTPQWNRIDCAQSEIVLRQYSECRRSSPYTGEARGSFGGQFYAQWAGYTGSDTLVFVYLQRGTTPGTSIVVTPEGRETALSRPTPKVGSEGRNFSSVIKVSGGHARKFTMGSWTCFSFAKDAPPAPAGYEFWMFGYSCGKNADWHNDVRIGEFVTGLDVRRR